MKRILPALMIGLALGVVGTWLLLKSHHEEHEEKMPEAGHKEESHVIKTNGQTLVKLEEKEQQGAGLKLATLEAATMRPEARVYGRVLDASPLVQSLNEIMLARSALDASQRELARLKVLAADQNTSARTLETADATARRDQIVLEGAQMRLVSTWGKGVAGLNDLPAFIHSLATMDTVLARLDLPFGSAAEGPPTSVRIAALTAEEKLLPAELLGPAPSADPQVQGQGFLVHLKTASLPPGAALSGWLSLPGEEEKGVVVPRSALVRHEGEAFIYVQRSPGLFERREVELEHPLEKGWFVAEGLKAGESIVISGAQQLLSTELKGEGGEE